MRNARTIALLCGVAAGVLIATGRDEAHKLVTSKYTYTEDVYPLVSQKCASCHVPGGIAPMSLLTYKDAVPWAESIRAELVSGHMPPWFADTGYTDFKDPHKISPRELDILLTWATGGTPQGPTKALPPPALKNEWRVGRPDLELPMPSAFTVAGDKMEDSHEFVVQPANDRDRFIRAADLLPGNPAVVHDATIFTRSSDGAENVLALWTPGFAPIAAPSGTGFRWPAGASLAVRIHYRKTWKYEGKPLVDRSTVGLYLVKTAAPREVKGVALDAAIVTLAEDVQALAFRTEGAPNDLVLRVEAVRPDGSRAPLVALQTRASWDQRYWFDRPVALPRGTRISVSTTPTDATAPKMWIDVVPNLKAATSTP